MLLKVWKHSSLCKACLFKTYRRKRLRHRFHILPGFSSQVFPIAVRTVENRGQVFLASTGFSNFPTFHSRVLENWTHSQNPFLQQVRPLVHFSTPNYGYYGLLSLFQTHKEQKQPYAYRSLRTQLRIVRNRKIAFIHGIRKRSDFSTISLNSRIARIKRKKRQPFPRGSRVL